MARSGKKTAIQAFLGCQRIGSLWSIFLEKPQFLGVDPHCGALWSLIRGPGKHCYGASFSNKFLICSLLVCVLRAPLPMGRPCSVALERTSSLILRSLKSKGGALCQSNSFVLRAAWCPQWMLLSARKRNAARTARRSFPPKKCTDCSRNNPRKYGRTRIDAPTCLCSSHSL